MEHLSTLLAAAEKPTTLEVPWAWLSTLAANEHVPSCRGLLALRQYEYSEYEYLSTRT